MALSPIVSLCAKQLKRCLFARQNKRRKKDAICTVDIGKDNMTILKILRLANNGNLLVKNVKKQSIVCTYYSQERAKRKRTLYEGKGNDFTSNNVKKTTADEGDGVRENDDEESRFKLAEWLVTKSPKALKPYLRLARYDKPIGSWLLYWPCGWSIASAANPGCMPDLYLLTLFGAGAFIMRGAGCTINDMWDRDIDKRVSRTSTRPLVNGDLSMIKAWSFLTIQLTIGLTVLMQLNWFSVFLGASSMFLVITYPLTKRITYWPQLMLGLTFNWGALLGYSAVKNYVDLSICLPLYVAGVCWTIFYDTIYAHQDRRDDLTVGIKSTAIKFGKDSKLWLTGFGCTMLNGLIVSGLMNEQTWPYYASLTLIGSHLASQLFTLNINDPNNCAERFLSNAYVGLILFVGIVIGNYLKTEKKEKTSINEYMQKNDVIVNVAI